MAGGKEIRPKPVSFPILLAAWIGELTDRMAPLLVRNAIAVKRILKCGAAGIGASMLFIAAPVYDSLVKDGKLPTGVVGMLSLLDVWCITLWGWLNTEVLLPHWLVLIVATFLVVLGALAVWLLWPNHRVGTSAGRGPLDILSGDQLKVFMLLGLAAEHGGVVTLGQVVKNEKLSRSAALDALKHLHYHDLIQDGSCPGEESYELTGAGLQHYLDHERAAGT